MIKSIFDISDLSESDLRAILDYRENDFSLSKKNIGMLFENYSSRTRLSFAVGISQLNGNTIDIRFNELNISRDESFEDTFRTMNCYLDGLIYRTTNHQRLVEASRFFTKPIINALSDKSHPCQIISDLYTLKQKFNTLDLSILWMGDMNNVCFSLLEAANLINEIKLFICTPSEISQSLNWKKGSNISIINDLSQIELSKIQCVMTDVFISMNDESDLNKVKLLQPYSVDSKLMSKVSPDSVFMHCLPAKVGVEVSENVFKSNKSIVWKQAHNRLIAQKNLLSYITW